MKYIIWVLIGLTLIINLMTLQDGHNWGDDFAQYIINARNIIDGKPFTSGVMLDKTVIYPPGLPLMLAPVLKIFGLNFKALKILNIVSWYLSILFLYTLFLRGQGRRFALMAAVFLACSSFFFVYKQNVLSDIPFFLFFCSSLYTFDRWKDDCPYTQKRLFFAGFLISISAALWLRSAGVVMFAASLFYFIFILRDKKATIATVTIFMINELLLFSWMGWQPGFLVSAGHNPQEFLKSILEHFVTVFEGLWYFFCPSQTFFSNCFFNGIDPIVRLTAPFVYLMMCWSFIRGLLKKDISYLECFSFFYISMLIFWSGYGAPYFAVTRLVFPLIPFAFIGVLRALALMKKFKLDLDGLIRVSFLLLVLINITNVAIERNFNDDVFVLPVNSELINWMKLHLKLNDHFMFCKPRALALFTDRVGAAPWVIPEQKLHFLQRINDLGISYVVALKDNDPDGLKVRLGINPRFKLVWENKGYEIFKFIN